MDIDADSSKLSSSLRLTVDGICSKLCRSIVTHRKVGSTSDFFLSIFRLKRCVFSCKVFMYSFLMASLGFGVLKYLLHREHLSSLLAFSVGTTRTF